MYYTSKVAYVYNGSEKGSVTMVKAFYRETWAEINADAILYNVQEVKKLLKPDQKLMAVVKANAYGHGDVEVADLALQAGANMLAVAFLDEAISLRQKGVKAPILVLGAVPPLHVKEAIKWNVTITAYSKQWIEEVIADQANNGSLTIHLKIDTGMGRLGLRSDDEIKAVATLLKSQSFMEVEGVFTHFATADELNSIYFQNQYHRFQSAVQLIQSLGINPPLVHCANSAAIFQQPENLFTAARLGISMYGLSPSPEMKEIISVPLKEAFSLHSTLVHVKKVEPGSGISYGITYESEKAEWIGTVPIGYADGWIRKLHNFTILVKGKKVPVVGRICMDQLMVRLPEQYPVGTKVTLIGKQGNEQISIDQVAQHLETINYEVPCMISARVPRVIVKNQEQVNITNYLLNEHN